MIARVAPLTRLIQNHCASASLFLKVAAIASLSAVIGWAVTGSSFLDVTRPVVAGLLRITGIEGTYSDTEIILGQLRVPWTRDCAGLNTLLILAACAVWFHRRNLLAAEATIALALTIPLGLAANVARVLTLVAVRWLLFPEVESMQTHYLIGLLWALPALIWLMPGRCFSQQRLTSAVHACCVLALLFPVAGAPGGVCACVCALLCLSQCRPEPLTRLRIAATVAWAIGGLMVLSSQMESLWLPFLLSCPALLNRSTVLAPSRWVLLAGTVTLFSMHPAVQAGIAAVAAWAGWKLWSAPSGAAETAHDAPTGPGAHCVALALVVFFLLPFTSQFLVHQQSLEAPRFASSVALKSTPSGGYVLRIPDQSPSMDVLWFNPLGGGRHHTVSVCMKFRGVEVKPVTSMPSVETDGKRWMREFFLHNGKLISSYAGYLKATFFPGSSPGVHVIIVGDQGKMSAPEFAQSAELLMQRVFSMRIPE